MKTRMEEPGGGWRMEVLNNPFNFIQNDLIFNQFVSRIEGGEDCLDESESFHLNLSNFQ